MIQDFVVDKNKEFKNNQKENYYYLNLIVIIINKK